MVAFSIDREIRLKPYLVGFAFHSDPVHVREPRVGGDSPAPWNRAYFPAGKPEVGNEMFEAVVPTQIRHNNSSGTGTFEKYSFISRSLKGCI